MAISTARQTATRSVLAALICAFCVLAVWLLISGSEVKAALVPVLLFAPFALYLAFERPLIFPFGLYVLLVPFDNLLAAGSLGTITKLLGIVSGACLLLWLARRRNAIYTGKSVPILIALLGWMVLSVLWALDQRAAMQILPTYGGLMLLYAALSVVPISMRQFCVLLVAIAAGGTAAAAYGAHEFFTNPTLAGENPSLVRLVVQAGSSFIDPNHFSNALLFPFAIVLMFALRTRSFFLKIAAVAGLAVFTVAIVFSGSREGVTGVALLAAYYLFRSRHRLQVVVATLCLTVVAASMQAAIWQRFGSVFNTGGSGRTSIWAVAIEALKHRLLQGYGIGNFSQAYDMYYLSVHQPYPFGFSSPAHNLVMHYTVELGLVGFALVCWFVGYEFVSLRRISPGSDLFDYRIMLEGTLIAIAGVSLTIDLFTYKYAWLVFSAVALLRNVAATRQAVASDEIRAAKPDMTAIRPPRSRIKAFPC